MKFSYGDQLRFKVNNMNSYETYLESVIELREKEIKIYKEFIEQELKCRIRDEVFRETKFDGKGAREVCFKVITIPQSQYVIQIDN